MTFETLLTTARGASRPFQCRCGQSVFFHNSECPVCHIPLGYDAQQARVLPLRAGAFPGQWQAAQQPEETDNTVVYHRCGNYQTPASCNWLIPLPPHADPARGLIYCVACGLNRTIPDLSFSENTIRWNKIESAKRRMVAQLLALELPVSSRVEEDPELGLAFDWLQSFPDMPAAMTGYGEGIITLNIEEADDSTRDRIRHEMREPYRTLLGHLRHESGHYYWERLIENSPLLEDFRLLFGDEREDYVASLERNYEQGPPSNWPRRFVSGYASAHPWEDWAESWAHYLHMRDIMHTAMSFGVDVQAVALEHQPFEARHLWRANDPGTTRYLAFINHWMRLATALNELSAAMGQPDFYPFAVPHPAVAKLQFIDYVVRNWRTVGSEADAA